MRKKKNIVLREVLVENYAAEGKSLARKDGKVIFIEGVVPGDVVDVRLGKNKKDWAEGHAIKFHSFSDERIQPFCQHFGVCGGCQWQMLPYSKQLEFKQQQVFDVLTRIGKVPLPPISPIIGADETQFYRNKLEYTFSTREFTVVQPPPKKFDWQKEQENGEEVEEAITTANINTRSEDESTIDPQALVSHSALGFHAKGFFDKVVHIEKCWLQEEPTNAIRNTIRQYAHENDLSFYDFREHTGMLRNLLIRICTTGEMMVNVVIGEVPDTARENLLAFIKERFPAITTILYTINLKKNDSLYDLVPVVYSGKGYIIEKLSTTTGDEYYFKIGPKSFFQTNTRQGEKLYAVTKEFAELDGSQVVYDLYCGTGSIGIYCSHGARKVVGVEAIEEAVSDAKQNALLNKLDKTAFFTGDVIEICTTEFFKLNGIPDVVIVDPPRVGMHQKLVDKILEIKAPTVVYVSCNPATQARDLALLDQLYVVTRVQPVDMFPHTHHIENVVQLKLK